MDENTIADEERVYAFWDYERTISYMEPGDVKQYSFPVTVPAGTIGRKSFYVWVLVDPRNEVAEKDELNKWFFPDSPALKEILGILSKHRERGWIINNLNNPSTKRLQSIKVKSIDKNKAVVATSEYWYLKWWDTKKKKYVYPYRETNRQQYILLKTTDGWKVNQNLRPSPRTSIPLRWSRRGR